MRFRLLGAALAAVLAGMAAVPVPAGATAVVLMYHRFGESHYPSTSITMEQFDAHLAELESGGYNVVPVPDIIAALRAGQTLPDRTVGITVDDAYLSVYTRAWPRLKEAELPFTMFVATDAVDRATSQGAAGYMTWDQVREMAASGVTIGSQTASHLHMPVAEAARNRAELGAFQRSLRGGIGPAPGHLRLSVWRGQPGGREAGRRGGVHRRLRPAFRRRGIAGRPLQSAALRT